VVLVGLRLPPGFESLFSPGDAAGHVLELDLPPGRLVAPQGSEPGTAPAYWLSDEPVNPDLWVRLRQAHAGSGLWPVLADRWPGDPPQPLVAGMVSPQLVADIDRQNPGEVLAAWWREWIEDGESDDEYDSRELEPFGRVWPGLAPSDNRVGQAPDEFADQFVRDHDDGTSQMLLVPAARSADVVTALGCPVPVNHTEDLTQLSAVLRSWEDRFGARVIQLSFDTLVLAVAAPPASAEHAEQVGAEHLAFCPDNIIQGPGTIRAYAAEVRGKDLWSFWWD
jgi:hypothetical protein